METQNVKVEYLSPEDVPEDLNSEMVPLKFPAPLEQFKNLFERMAGIRSKVILWEKKTIITDAKSRDEAIRLRTTVTRTAKAIDDAYLAATAELREGLKEVRGFATEAQVALVGTKDDPKVGVAGRLTGKISDYAARCKAEEEELKRKALAKQRLIEDEIAAWEEETKMREEHVRLLEDLKLQKLRDEALQKAQAEGQTETDELSADLQLGEAMAQIDADRAKREKEAEDQRIANEKTLQQVEQQTNNTFAVATAKGKVKGVQEVWALELIDEQALDKKFMVYDESKARAFLKAGFHDKKEKDPEKIIPGLRCRLVLGKGGK